MTKIETENAVIAELDELLDLERDALMSGDLEHLARMTENKENIIDHVNGLANPDGAELAQIHKKISHNQMLLAGTIKGIRHVADKMAVLRKVRKGLDTYDRNGHRKNVVTRHGTTVEKRA